MKGLKVSFIEGNFPIFPKNILFQSGFKHENDKAKFCISLLYVNVAKMSHITYFYKAEFKTGHLGGKCKREQVPVKEKLVSLWTIWVQGAKSCDQKEERARMKVNSFLL